MKIALIQYYPAWEDKETNKKKILSLVQDIKGVELFIFPEMTLSGFTMKSNEMSETYSRRFLQIFFCDCKRKII